MKHVCDLRSKYAQTCLTMLFHFQLLLLVLWCVVYHGLSCVSLCHDVSWVSLCHDVSCVSLCHDVSCVNLCQCVMCQCVMCQCVMCQCVSYCVVCLTVLQCEICQSVNATVCHVSRHLLSCVSVNQCVSVCHGMS